MQASCARADSSVYWREVKSTRLLGYARRGAVQKDMETWPFAVLEGPNGKPQIEVTLKGEKK